MMKTIFIFLTSLLVIVIHFSDKFFIDIDKSFKFKNNDIHIANSSDIKSIDSLYRVPINGIDHAVFVKSENTDNPLLLIIHGGPGFSDYYLWQSYNKELEEKFTVVTYDQRGSGLTYTDDTPVESMSFSQLTDDAYKLISFLKNEFNQSKVYLIGYSAGTITGVYLSKLYPEEIEVYISVGQVVNGIQNEKLCLDFTYNKAVEDNNLVAINELKPLLSTYPSGTTEIMVNDLKLIRKWTRVYYGDFCEGTSMEKLFAGIDPVIKSNINFDLINKGEDFSMHALWQEIIDLDLFSTHTQFEIPMYFMVGMCDYNTPFKIAEEYYQSINAPFKKIYHFQNSGHYMQFVENKKFNDIMISEILNPK